MRWLASLDRISSQWKNPCLIVGPEGIEIIVGMARDGRKISVGSVGRALEGLPDPAWSYGLIVEVQGNGNCLTVDGRPLN